MLLVNTTVSKNTRISPDLYCLDFKAPRIASRALPGQFIHIQIENSGSILRRPFSIYSRIPPRISIVYRVVGTVTRKMASLQEGDFLSVMGPVGKGFSLKLIGVPVLVAGGTGLATLHFLKENIKPGILFFGARSKEHIWGVQEFKKAGWTVYLTTEDGSQGTRGIITDVLNRFLKGKHSTKKIKIFLCGPMGMLSEVARLCRKFSIPGEASLENVLACGVGACQGCVVPMRNGGSRYKRVCIDGPVFDIKTI